MNYCKSSEKFESHLQMNIKQTKEPTMDIAMLLGRA